MMNETHNKLSPLQRAGRAKLGILAVLALLLACSGERNADSPPQQWQNLEVSIESRPSPPRVGMNEVLVMVTDSRGRPGYDLMVSLRTSDQDPWKQAIEDGQVGVYRRAVEFAPGERSMLQVQIKRNGTESALFFPLKLQSK